MLFLEGLNLEAGQAPQPHHLKLGAGLVIGFELH